MMPKKKFDKLMRKVSVIFLIGYALTVISAFLFWYIGYSLFLCVAVAIFGSMFTFCKVMDEIIKEVTKKDGVKKRKR